MYGRLAILSISAKASVQFSANTHEQEISELKMNGLDSKSSEDPITQETE